MHAKHMRAALVRGHGGAHGSKETLARLATRQLADEALARCTHDDRKSPCGEAIEARDHPERIPAALAEAESRVECDARAFDAGGQSHIDASLELAQYLVQWSRSVCRSRVRCHVGNSAARVHEHDAHAGPRADVSHPRIEAKRRYVVHDASTRSHGCLGNAALYRIDRDDCVGILRSDALDHRHDAAGLHVFAHFCRTLRTGVLSAHVEYVRALTEELTRASQPFVDGLIAPAIAAAVRTDAYHVHHQRPVERELTAADGPGGRHASR